MHVALDAVERLSRIVGNLAEICVNYKLVAVSVSFVFVYLLVCLSFFLTFIVSLYLYF